MSTYFKELCYKHTHMQIIFKRSFNVHSKQCGLGTTPNIAKYYLPSNNLKGRSKYYSSIVINSLSTIDILTILDSIVYNVNISARIHPPLKQRIPLNPNKISFSTGG